MKLKTLAALFVLSLIGSLALAQQKEIVFWHI